MSMWTHIVAVLDVDTNRCTDDIVTYVEEKLKDAPKITGSEKDAYVYVNRLPGHNASFYDGKNDKKYQTRVVITVIGDLRDRMKVQTEKEWDAFKSFIGYDMDGEWIDRDDSLNFMIRNCSCEIKGR